MISLCRSSLNLIFLQLNTFFHLLFIFYFLIPCTVSISVGNFNKNVRRSECFRDNERGGFSIGYLPRANASVYIIGDVNLVLNGTVLPQTSSTFFKAKGTIGFGAGAIESLSGLGEAFYSDDFAHVRTTDNASVDYFKTIHSEDYLSPFSVFVYEDDVPDAEVGYLANEGHSSVSLLEVYTKVYEKIGRTPFCFQGVGHFDQMDGIAVSKAPIYGEPLFGEILEGYYSKPNFKLFGLSARIFGCAANFSEIRDENLRLKLSRALYVNPHDASSASSLQVHSHSFSIDSCINSRNVKFGQNANYGQNGNNGRNTNYGQNVNYGQNGNNGRNTNYGQNANYGQNGNNGRNTNYGQNVNNGKIVNNGQMNENKAGEVYHLLSNSTLSNVRIYVYKIDKREKLVEYTGNSGSSRVPNSSFLACIYYCFAAAFDLSSFSLFHHFLPVLIICILYLSCF